MAGRAASPASISARARGNSPAASIRLARTRRTAAPENRCRPRSRILHPTGWMSCGLSQLLLCRQDFGAARQALLQFPVSSLGGTNGGLPHKSPGDQRHVLPRHLLARERIGRQHPRSLNRPQLPTFLIPRRQKPGGSSRDSASSTAGRPGFGAWRPLDSHQTLR
jgi:hypothetical protein